MPTTRQNISLIQYRLPKYSRTEIMAVLDEIQLIVYSADVKQTLRIDSATGRAPLFATTDGVFEYDCPSDCRRTIAMLSNSPISTFSRTRPSPASRRYYYHVQGYYEIPISSRDATVDQLATVTFVENPGTTTDKFLHVYHIKHTPITTEDVQLTLPEHVHYKLRQGVQALLSTEEYGQTGFDDAVIEKISRSIRNQLNRGAQPSVGRTPVRQQDQLFPDEIKGYYS